MATYIEIKQLLKEILCIEEDVTEDCDIVFPILSYTGQNMNSVFF